MEVYLDNSATTKCCEEAARAALEAMTESYGNPSSMHRAGMKAEQYIKETKEIIGKCLKVSGKEIYFTSGGTESDNLAIIGTALANQRAGKCIVTTRMEHPAVVNSMKYLEEQGFEIVWLPVDRDGIVDSEVLRESVTDETILVSIMHVNNEIGSVQPIAAFSEVIKSKNAQTLFHVDAVQGFGKYNIYPRKWGIDLLSGSGHKIHGPKGTGFLYAAEKVKIKPLLFGGGQQKDLRPGTEPVPGIAGLGKAVQEVYSDLDKKTVKMQKLKMDLAAGMAEITETKINGGPVSQSAPHILNVSFAGIRSEVLLHALEEKGVYVSSGSACASNHPAVSSTLKSIGVEDRLLETAIRFSLSEYTTEAEVAYTIECLKEIVPHLRKYIRQ